jgi:hypothetical protein
MTKNEFIIGNQYIYRDTVDARIYTYEGQSWKDNVGVFKNHLGEINHIAYANIAPHTKLVEPQYPNPPLPHCEERIAFAQGANIEYLLLSEGIWHNSATPQWFPELKYRVKVEKTKDELRIEELERLITENLIVISKHRIELADLKPSYHY